MKKIKSALLSKTEDEKDEETQKSLIECSLGVELTTKEVCKKQSFIIQSLVDLEALEDLKISMNETNSSNKITLQSHLLDSAKFRALVVFESQLM